MFLKINFGKFLNTKMYTTLTNFVEKYVPLVLNSHAANKLTF